MLVRIEFRHTIYGSLNLEECNQEIKREYSRFLLVSVRREWAELKMARHCKSKSWSRNLRQNQFQSTAKRKISSYRSRSNAAFDNGLDIDHWTFYLCSYLETFVAFSMYIHIHIYARKKRYQIDREGNYDDWLLLSILRSSIPRDHPMHSSVQLNVWQDDFDRIFRRHLYLPCN